MSLTTPVLRELDSIFPGENWFFYWKTSSSLWKSKLEDFSSRVVLCPINWSIHHKGHEDIDFLGSNPEANLKKLVSVIRELGKEAIFLLPLGPAPFLPNGGVPHVFSRFPSLNKENAIYGVADPEGRINKMYSFFDNRVFLGFSFFVSKLGEFFYQESIETSVYGIQSHYLEGSEVCDYMTDNSRVFDDAFGRYLKEEGNRTVAQDMKKAKVLDPGALEIKAKKEFFSSIKNLYVSCAQEALEGYWERSLPYIFVGGGHRDLLSRAFDFDESEVFSSGLFESLVRDFIPSSVLLPEDKKKEIIKRQFREIVEKCINVSVFQKDLYINEGTSQFLPYHTFEFYHCLQSEKLWRSVGVLPILKKQYPFTYKICTLDSLSFFEDKDYSEKVIFASGSGLKLKGLNTLLKIFMNGGKVLLDVSEMDDGLLKKLELFILENKLNSEKINFKCSLEHIFLGEGHFLTFYGKTLSPLSQNSKNTFWERVLNVFGLKCLKFKGGEDLLSFWNKRDANSLDLDYDEVRRLNIYNPTSYKKKLKITLEKNFSLLKVLDQIQSSVTTSPYQIDVKVLPGGSLSLDFGVFS